MSAGRSTEARSWNAVISPDTPTAVRKTSVKASATAMPPSLGMGRSWVLRPPSGPSVRPDQCASQMESWTKIAERMPEPTKAAT